MKINLSASFVDFVKPFVFELEQIWTRLGFLRDEADDPFFVAGKCCKMKIKSKLCPLESAMQIIKNFFLIFFKYFSPLFLLLLPLMALYGFLYPWPEAKTALSKYDGEIVFLSGMKSQYSGSYEKHSNTYLIIKANPIASETVSVTTDSNGLYEITQEDGGLLSILFLYASLIFSLWWFWIRKRNITERSSGNRQ